ncbi:MAG: hypothetical protein ACP5PM_09505 [Acidimicrobiales bacterium]
MAPKRGQLPDGYAMSGDDEDFTPVEPVSHGIDRVEVTFDEPGLVANAGLLLVATLVTRLGLEAVIDTTVRIPSTLGGFAPGRKVITLVHAMVAGATHVDHTVVLRARAAGTVLPHPVMAPSTLGTFLRAFTSGRVRKLEAVVGEALRRAWSAMTLPARLVIDVDSTICEVAGRRRPAPPTATPRSWGCTLSWRHVLTAERRSR